MIRLERGHGRREVATAGEAVAARRNIDHRLDGQRLRTHHQHLVDDRVGRVVRDLHLNAAVRLGGEGGSSVRQEVGDRRARRLKILHIGDEDRDGVGDALAPRPAGDRDLVAEPRLHLRAVVDAAAREKVLDDLVHLLIERRVVGEARQAADQAGEVHLLPGRWLQVDVEVEGAVRRARAPPRDRSRRRRGAGRPPRRRSR